MARTIEADPTVAAGKKRQPSEKTSKTVLPRDPGREFVESIVLALVLAFLFKTFEAEAFVIPTGSMAPTLMGRHKDLKCERCQFPFTSSASGEVDQSNDQQTTFVSTVVCPNCRHRMDLNPEFDAHRQQVNKEYPPSYNGDRIIVAKFPYELHDPDRWDVAVFKYPTAAEENFIKRLVGLPNETVIIYHGDLYTAAPEDRPRSVEEFVRLRNEGKARIARKPASKVVAMLQTVYDNDYVLPELIEAGWPPRWNDDADSGWKTSADYRSFECQGDSKKDAWLRYVHTPPPVLSRDRERKFWQTVDEGKLPPNEILARALPQLVTDFYGYNAFGLVGAGMDDSLALNWVGDLAVSCEVVSRSTAGKVLFELVEAGRKFRCEIDLSNGEARLFDSKNEDFSPVGQTTLVGETECSVRFANVDDCLWLWVDGRVVEFDQSCEYESMDHGLPKNDDLQPAGIGSRGADLAIEDVLLARDVYYISANDAFGQPIGRRGHEVLENHNLFDPESSKSSFRGRGITSFVLGEDEFLALGDNSPGSSDSRFWPKGSQFVHRDLLIGKAVFVYWPHGLAKIPGTSVPFPFSLFPNFGRMKPVR